MKNMSIFTFILTLITVISISANANDEFRKLETEMNSLTGNDISIGIKSDRYKDAFFTDTKVLEVIETESKQSTRYPLTLIIDGDSWAYANEVKPVINSLQEVFAQCNIEFSPIYVIRSKITFWGGEPGADNSLRGESASQLVDAINAVKEMRLPKPIVSFHNKVFRQGSPMTSLYNSAFGGPINQIVLSSYAKNINQYNHLARALLGSFWDSVKEPGLLMSADKSTRTNIISTEQCAGFVKFFNRHYSK